MLHDLIDNCKLCTLRKMVLIFIHKINLKPNSSPSPNTTVTGLTITTDVLNIVLVS